MRQNLRWLRIVRDFFDVISSTDVLIVWVGPRCPRCFKMGTNGYCIRTAWAPKVRRPTPKSTHVWPSSPSVWSNHILCSFYIEFSNLSYVQILLIGHVDQVFHKFCGAIAPSLMVFFTFTFSLSIWHFSHRTLLGWNKDSDTSPIYKATQFFIFHFSQTNFKLTQQSLCSSSPSYGSL